MRRVLALLALLLALAGCAVGTGPASPATSRVSPTPAVLTVPNVVGLNASVAVDELRRAGFTNIDLGTVDGRPFVVMPQNWTVKTQSAAAGTALRADAKIVLGCKRNG